MNEKMRELTENFPNQVRESIEIADKSKLTAAKGVKNIVISGLGGSGIGASIVSNWVYDSCKLPITINKGYFLPNYVKKNTLVICCSYSGNTEETMHVLDQAYKSGAKIVCISSGGKMIEFCKAYNIDYIQVPGGMPPRTCIGYSIVQLMQVLTFNKFIPGKLFKQLIRIPDFLKKEEASIQKLSSKLCDKIFDKMPIIYGDERFEGVVVRYRQQINENAKILCWHHVIPEMNHNEMVGWREENPDLAVLFIDNNLDFRRNVQRREINEETIRKYTPNIHHIQSKGRNLIEQSFYHMFFGDLLSIYLAEKRGFEAMEIDVINHLKSTLEKTSF
jgi:glucose/mannose-6-phosphate isomerase